MKTKKTNWFFVLIVIVIAVPLLLASGGAGTLAYVRAVGTPEQQLCLKEFLKDFEDWSDWYWPWEERPANMQMPPLLTNLKYYWDNIHPHGGD